MMKFIANLKQHQNKFLQFINNVFATKEIRKEIRKKGKKAMHLIEAEAMRIQTNKNPKKNYKLHSLTLFMMSIFGATHEWGRRGGRWWRQKAPPPPPPPPPQTNSPKENPNNL